MELQRRQLFDENKFADLLKQLGSRLTDIFAQDINKLQSELLNDHIQSLRTRLDLITIADLRTEVESLGVRLDSLISTTKIGRAHV